jgi:competence protein ComEC
VALAGSFGYLLLAGATVPTQRAFVMTALVLLAVLVDRSALSMRTVALAAGGILLLRPEALLGASFQMSFAAVIALIAVYEGGAVGLGRRGREGVLPRPLLYLAGVTLTTLVASTATAPLTVYAFQRFATYGVVANLVAVPITAFWIMPAGLFGLLLMPLGLDGPCFVVMGLGVELVLATAATVAAWPGAAILTEQPPTGAIAAVTLGGLWLCLWRRPWRWLGTVGFALGVAIAAADRPPDLLVGGGGDLVAARLEDGRLALSPWRRDSFVTDSWLRHAGQAEAAPWPESGAPAAAGDRLRCDGLGCIYWKEGRTIALTRRAEGLEEDCVRADLVVTALRIDRCPPGDGATVLGGRELWASHGTALRLTGAGIERRSVAAERGRRPWVR